MSGYNFSHSVVHLAWVYEHQLKEEGYTGTVDYNKIVKKIGRRHVWSDEPHLMMAVYLYVEQSLTKKIETEIE